MKLCKACNGKIPDVNYNWTYCERPVCVKARSALAKIKYKKPHIHFKSETMKNWICKCPEQWVVPSEYRMCDRCKATAPQAHRMDKKFRVFKLEKHGIPIDSFVQSYFDRQNNGSVKPS